MMATLSAFLSARNFVGDKVKRSTVTEEESCYKGIIRSNTVAVRRLSVLPRDERPLQPQRARSNIMDTRGHSSLRD
jgi:hypothetical protein